MFLQPVIPILILSAVLTVISAWKLFTAKTRKNRTQWILRTLTVILLGATALRPSVTTLDGSEVYNSRYDVYFVVDLTSSIAAEDWAEDETRLDGVKRDINNLLDDYVGAKFSLITFNNSANVRVPLTPDATALATSVNTLIPEITQLSQGSNTNQAAETVKQVMEDTDLAETDEEERAKIVLYFGDGEQTSDNDEGDFTEVGEKAISGKVYGYGTSEGGKMKVQTGYYITSGEPEYIKDFNGEVGISVIDEDRLQEIATQLGGEYEHRSADSRIQPLELSEDQLLDLQKSEESSINNTVEYYWVFLIPMTVLLFLQAGLMFRTANRLGVVRNGS